MTEQDLGEYFKAIISVNPLWKGKTVSITVIANPKAGGFTQKKVSAKLKALLEEAVNAAQKKELQAASVTVRSYATRYAGHAGELAKAALVEAMSFTDKDHCSLIISAGGDGTCLDIQEALLKEALSGEQKKQAVKEKVAVLRLPMGTGNDGTDGRTLEETLALLEGNCRFANSRAIKVYYEGNAENLSKENYAAAPDLYGKSEAPWYAFNIASIGIDAFITYMTNRMKEKISGDSYQMWVNVAAAFYDKHFHPQQAHIEVLDENNTFVESVNSKIEFALLGVSGHRTYGSNHKILPDDNNICITRKLSLFTKLLNINAFTDGTHLQKKLSSFYKGRKLRISYNGSILVQMDGEAHLLFPQMFPLVIEQTEPIIRIIENADSTIDKGAVAVQ